MPDRVVRTTLIIDDHGAVKVVKGVGEESGRTERSLGHLDKSVKQVGSSFKGLKGMIGAGLGAVGAGGVLFGLSDVITKTKEVAEETEKFHSITGLGAQSSLRYSQALRARGLNSDNLVKAFGYLAKNVHTAEIQENKFAQTQATAAAKGKVSTAVLGRQAMAIRELGINLGQYIKLSPDDKIKALTKAFEGLAAGEKKTRLERELFGRGGNQLSILLEKNSLSLNNTASKVEKYFGTIHGGLRGQEELLEKQREAQLAFEGLEYQLGTKLTPALISVFEWFSKVTLEVEKGKGTWGEVAQVFEKLASFGSSVAGFFKTIAGDLGIKLSGSTLGGVLAAAAAAGVVEKVPGVKGTATVGKKLGKYALSHPELGPVALGGAIPFVSAAGIRAGVEALSPGYLKQHSLAEAERIITGRTYVPGVGYGKTELQGTPAPFGGAAGVTGSIKVDVHLDSNKVGEAVVRNPRSRRHISEATAIYSNGMAAHR